MKLLAALIVIPLMLGQQPARDPLSRPANPTGTATIGGTVVTDDQTAQPIRRARVELTSTDGSTKRNDMTDDNGAFVFGNLPAGRYSLSASKPAWLTTNYGAARAQRPGTSIVVAEGARLTGIAMRMARGAVITGIVRDATGQPAAGVRLQVSRLVTKNGERFLEGVNSGSPTQPETDDSGPYRIFGLPPGDVIVSAVQPALVNFRGEINSFRRVTDDEFNHANELAQQGRGDLPAPASPVKLAMVFYPGTTEPGGATVLSLAAGDERTGIDITLQAVPTSSIEGILTDATGLPLSRTTVLAVSGSIQLGSLMGLNGVTTGMTDASGQYRLTGLAPGEYSVLATSGDRLWGETGVTVSGQDLNVPLTLQPFLTMTGRVAFEGAATVPSAQPLRYSMSATGSVASLLARATGGTVGDGAFSSEIVPGKYRLQFTGIPSGWYPKSAIARGQDAFDLPIAIGPNDRLTEFLVTFTDKPSELTGSLVDATGRPASEYFVVVFSTDKQFWTQPSRRVVQVRPASDGGFSVKGLPAGDYFIAALTDIEPGESLTPEFLESIVAATSPVRVHIADGQRTVQPLKIGGGQSRK